jgi:putative membrane protein
MKISITPIIVAALAFSAAQAQTAPPTTADRGVAPENRTEGRTTDRQRASHSRLSSEEFVEKAAAAGHAEVEMGKLGVQKAQSQAVRAYAQKMVADHGKGNQELAAAAEKHGIEAPSSPDAMHRVVHKKFDLQKADAEFDRDFMRQMVKDHEATVALFEAATQADDVDPELKALAKKKLPTLREHLAQAQQLAQQTDR